MNPAEREKAYWTLGVISVLRGKGGHSEEEIAAKAAFASVEQMRWQLKRWGLPDWFSSDASDDDQERKPRGSGSEAPLPRAKDAGPLFRERLGALDDAVEELPRIVETVQGGRFVATSVYRDPILFFRDDFSDDAWRQLCESQGEDPTSDRVLATGLLTRSPAGASQAPPRPLVALIAAYALADGDMDELLRVLHPNPSEADPENLSRLLYAKKSEHGVDGLIRRAEQVAILLRGGKLGKGVSSPEVSPREHNTACHITYRRELGWSFDRICEELVPKGFTRDDISRLAGLKLRWPEG